MPTIAVVEDDAYLRDEIIQTFQRKGYSATGISCFASAGEALLSMKPALVILDVNLPEQSGYALCRYLKARASFPILILTARDTLSDELTALGLGADDFLTKPCHPDRLIARAERLLSTYGKVKNVIQTGDLILDTDTYKLLWQGKIVLLPETEGKILRCLMEGHRRIIPKKELLNAVWGTDEFVDDNILQVNMTRLRKSLAGLGLEKSVRTLRGQGYALEVK